MLWGLRPSQIGPILTLVVLLSDPAWMWLVEHTVGIVGSSGDNGGYKVLTDISLRNTQQLPTTSASYRLPDRRVQH